VVPGYVVAGKTGTAQKVENGRYSMIDHVASFVGFVPASRPALVVLVSLDTPRGPRNEGGDVAAPVFARVAEQALRYMAISSDDPGRVLRATPVRPDTIIHASVRRPATDRTPSVEEAVARPSDDDPRIMPDLRGESAREAAIAAARRGLIVELRGSGSVVEQTPDPGTEIEPGQNCVLRLSSERAAAASAAEARE
jgi:hypothetical protein